MGMIILFRRRSIEPNLPKGNQIKGGTNGIRHNCAFINFIALVKAILSFLQHPSWLYTCIIFIV